MYYYYYYYCRRTCIVYAGYRDNIMITATDVTAADEYTATSVYMYAAFVPGPVVYTQVGSP